MDNRGEMIKNMEKFDSKTIEERLKKAGATRSCHRCGNNNFVILDGYSSILLQQDLSNIGGITIGGPAVPIVYVVCDKCGAITSHAIGALGLLDNLSDT
ncbi:hypothetical protein BKG96_04775 [Rodentibacter caecimuris]|uniref:Uncharacterized protein n=1 Tax=Rodentibacter caecimuris TaxID=1796644 RepID=A0A1V3KMK1_9PAST|nr:hypothetical protein [Rodentibacter heylii]OOF78856.1 hypothetical protein BKG96_04775 [Rodentibacter heylii]